MRTRAGSTPLPHLGAVPPSAYLQVSGIAASAFDVAARSNFVVAGARRKIGSSTPHPSVS
ncbi:MAG: hypothetical protein EXR71_15345 [Myxococcales bacterium]|nr:hypothetical protein [Myxococcales bacterium]